MATREDSPAVARYRASLGPDAVLTDREINIIDAMSANQEEALAAFRRDMMNIIVRERHGAVPAPPSELPLSQASIDAITAGIYTTYPTISLSTTPQ